tara:strand:- start:51 stop:746 length:696 start_codon:yes stop_codon:yes gene_type:complete
MSLLNLDNLEELVESLVRESIKETYGPVLVGDDEEVRKQNSVSSEIEDLHLRAPNKPEKNIDDNKDIDEEEEVTLTTSQSSEEKEENKPKVEFTKELPDVIEVEQIIDTLNLIRSGPSLKDEGLLERFSEYFGALSGSEKIALLGFLDGISQVIVGGVAGTDAQTPDSAPFNVEMESNPQQKRQDTVKSVEKVSVKTKNVSNQTAAGTETPIIVGEVADKTLILNKLRVLL